MQYLLLIYEAEGIWDSKTDDEKRAVLAEHGVLQARMNADRVEFTGLPLMSTSTAVSLRQRGSELQVTDGPFAETKEALAGFYLVDVPTIEQAIEYAAMIPNVGSGTIEVRPADDHSNL